jgi:hypothetical protein
MAEDEAMTFTERARAWALDTECSHGLRFPWKCADCIAAAWREVAREAAKRGAYWAQGMCEQYTADDVAARVVAEMEGET